VLVHIFAAFQVVAYRRFWFAQVFSLIGSWLQASAISWLVVTILYPNQPALATSQLGVLTAIQWTPSLVFSLFAGAVLDRVSRRLAMLVSQITLMSVAFGFTVVLALKLESFELVASLAFLGGLANVVDMVARQSLVPSLVPREFMSNAIALNTLAFNTTRVLGGALFGVVAPLGLTSIFAFNALSFLGVLYAIWRIQIPQPVPKTSALLEDIKIGLQYVRNNKAVGTPILLLMLLSLTVINFQVVVPTFARFALNLEEGGFGLLSAAFGVGAVSGAVFQAARASKSFMLWGALQLTLAMLGLAVAPGIWWAAIALFLAGSGMNLFTVSANSMVQSHTPDGLRARVMSVYSLVFAGMSPPGSLFAGWLMATLGSRGGIAVLGGLGVLAVLSLMVSLRRLEMD
jgi:MFS family permease